MQSCKMMYHNLRFTRSISTSIVNPFRSRLFRTVDEALREKGIRRLRPEKAMYKLLFRENKRNPFYFRPPVGAPSIALRDVAKSVTSSRICDTKRVRALNKLFMRYIPEILITGQLGLPLSKYDVEVSNIHVTHNYTNINVYWVPRGTDEDEEIQNILDQIAYPLRSELINLKAIGLVPPIKFKKDRRIAYLQEMERLLKIADYGEDYIPTFLRTNDMRRDLQLEIYLPSELKQKVQSIEENEDFTEEEEREIPSLRTNTFGLNRQKIMDKISEGLLKCRILDSYPSQTAESLLGESAIKEIGFSFEAQQIETWDRKAFLEFFKKQRIERRRLRKIEKRKFEKERLEALDMLDGKPDNEDYDVRAHFTTYAFSDEVNDTLEDQKNEQNS